MLNIFFYSKVDYITLPGWKTSIEDVREYDNLPENAKKYIKTIEQYVQVPGNNPA